MSSEHPNLHPKLKHLSMFHSFEPIIGSLETTQQFLEEVQCIPSRNSVSPTCCGLPMKVENLKSAKLGWIWRCSSYASKKKFRKKQSACRQIINPSKNTFFDGTVCRIAMTDVLAIIFCFVMQMKITDVIKHLASWRRHKDEEQVSNSTVSDYYLYCREIAEVISSHSEVKLGGADKSVQIDETFLTKRKYHRGRITEQMTIVVLGIYCKEDKTGLFFQVDGKSKTNIWPLIKKHVDPATTTICTDTAKQYHGIEKKFTDRCVHLSTNHSKSEYVDKNNPQNTINDLENQNKLLKKAIICRRSAKLLHQYMALFFYNKNILEKMYPHDLGSQIMTFLEDIAKVYPGYVNGEEKQGLFLKEFDLPSAESQDISGLLPPKHPRAMTIEDVIDNASDNESEKHEDDDL